MGHDIGQVFRFNGTGNNSLVLFGYFEYDGTSDCACSAIRDTEEDVYNNWRKENRKNCICGKEPIYVIIYTSYGSGFYWPAKACLDCKSIVDGLFPYPGDLQQPLKEWQWQYPKDGHPLETYK